VWLIPRLESNQEREFASRSESVHRDERKEMAVRLRFACGERRHQDRGTICRCRQVWPMLDKPANAQGQKNDAHGLRRRGGRQPYG